MKLSKRLKTIVNLIGPEDIIADVGCDHAYLSIYLAKNDLCQGIIATEVAIGPYNIALQNIKDNNLEQKIKLYLTDGLNNIEENLNTIVIAGMGTSTIIHILNNYDLSNVTKMIIQSNSDWIELRKFLNDIGYYIETEINTYENKKDYLTFLVKKSNRNNLKKELICGKFNSMNIEFYQRRKSKLVLIKKSIPNKNDIKYKELSVQINILKDYLS